MLPHFSRSEPPDDDPITCPGREIERPSRLLDVEEDEAKILLEQLDDAVFTALAGCEQSLEETRKLWPRVIAALGWELVDESREQYLRFAVETTRRLQEERWRSPDRSIAALEVISLLAR